MSRRMVVARVAFGLLLIALLYAGPLAYGLATMGGKVDPCLAGASRAGDVVVTLSDVPGPTQIEELQRYGRYGGSGGNQNHVVLLGVPPANVTMLSRLYWIDTIEALDGCPGSEDA